jgi:hypothetical protein
VVSTKLAQEKKGMEVTKWLDDYPLELSPAERAVARQALVDGYFMGYADAKNEKGGNVIVDVPTVPSWVQVDDEGDLL